MNKPGAFVAVTTTLLQLVGNDDSALTGLISHELAHEYIASEMVDAYKSHDLARQRELELYCDAVAVATIIALNQNPTRYAEILRADLNSSEENWQDSTMANVKCQILPCENG